MLLFGGIIVFFGGLFEVFPYQRENDLLTYAGGILFLVGVVLVSISLYGKGKV